MGDFHMSTTIKTFIDSLKLYTVWQFTFNLTNIISEELLQILCGFYLQPVNMCNVIYLTKKTTNHLRFWGSFICSHIWLFKSIIGWCLVGFLYSAWPLIQDRSNPYMSSIWDPISRFSQPSGGLLFLFVCIF